MGGESSEISDRDHDAAVGAGAAAAADAPRRGELVSKTMVAMPDGTRLLTRTYVPAGATRVPTILVRNPYRHIDDDVSIAAVARFHNERGYAYVWQSVRGTAGSEGVFYPYVDEARDGVATTAWIAEQAWSDGSVGTLGGSYLAFTALAAAVDNPRVKVVISDDGTVDERSSHRGGVVWGYLLDWLHLVQQGAFFDEAAVYPTITNALDPRGHDVSVLGQTSRYWQDFLANQDDPTFPRAGSLEPLYDKLCVPVLHVYSPTSGWTDPIDIHRGLTTRGCERHRSSQRLFVVEEPHTHHLSRLETERTYVTEAMLSALDRALKGNASDLGPGPAVSYAVRGELAPREAASWPPPGSSRVFYLGATAGEGRCSQRRPPQARSPWSLTRTRARARARRAPLLSGSPPRRSGRRWPSRAGPR